MSTVLLVSPPLHDPSYGDLGIATLKAILEREGITARCLHATLLYPYSTSQPLTTFLGWFSDYSAFMFAPHLYDHVSADDAARAVADCVLDQRGRTLAPPTAQESEELLAQVRDAVRFEVGRSGECIERCVAEADSPEYDVVGFSCTFERQLIAGLAIATRLKARRPSVRIMFGGAACYGPAARELVRCYPDAVDAVCHCEGDAVVAPLVRALRGQLSMATVPGIAWRDSGSAAVSQSPAPPPLVDLDELPIPDYDDFLEQHRASSWRSHWPPFLLLETSRGCWWGQKFLCTFCGANAHGAAYRKKSDARAFDELRYLWERYPEADRLFTTDNILEMGFFKTVLPQAVAYNRSHARPLRMFYEVKANLRREQVQMLADAGVVQVQPGIEAFDDDLLALMLKGSTALGQVQLIKWLRETGINAMFNLLVGVPGERPEHYEATLRLLPYITHLQAPRSAPVELHRFSPYFADPERYGIRNVRARGYYAFLYQAPGIDLDKVAYIFDFDHDQHQEQRLTDLHRQVMTAITAWQNRETLDAIDPLVHGGRLHYEDRQSTITVVDHRDDASSDERVVRGLAREVFDFLDRTHTAQAIQRRFAELDEEVMAALLDRWRHRRWLLQDTSGRLLIVVPARRRRLPGTARGIVDLPARAADPPLRRDTERAHQDIAPANVVTPGPALQQLAKAVE